MVINHILIGDIWKMVFIKRFSRLVILTTDIDK